MKQLSPEKKALIALISAIVSTGACLVLIGVALFAVMIYPREFFTALTNVAIAIGSVAGLIGFLWGVWFVAKRLFYFFLRHFG